MRSILLLQLYRLPLLSCANDSNKKKTSSITAGLNRSSAANKLSYQAQQSKPRAISCATSLGITRVLGTAGNLRIIKTGLQQILEQNNAAQTRLHSTVISNYSAANSLHKQIKKERGATTESDLESQIK
jgi:hypothetical protein